MPSDETSGLIEPTNLFITSLSILLSKLIESEANLPSALFEISSAKCAKSI